MTSYVNKADPFHYGSSLLEKKDALLKSKGLGPLRKLSRTHNTTTDDNVKELAQRLKELQRTDSIISGQSSRTKDSGFNSEAPSSFVDPNSELPSFGCDIRENFSLRHSLSLGALPIEDVIVPKQSTETPCCQPPPRPPSNPCGPDEASSSLHTKKKNRRYEDPKQATIRQHYYPEGGWGYLVVVVGILVQMLSHGLQLSFGIFLIFLIERWRPSMDFALWKFDLLGSCSLSISLIISPLTIAICRRKSTRITAVIGGLVISLGILFSSFANQFHQLYFSLGFLSSVGVGMVRDTSTLMVGQYFKRKRELVEIFLVSGSGIGISVMSIYFNDSMTSIGWRLGLQALAGILFLNFFLGTFYRSASLYHPQRRAILHLKTQKRKIKSKSAAHASHLASKVHAVPTVPEEKLPFLDFGTLRSRTVKIILLSTGFASFGLFAPLFLLARQAQLEKIELVNILKLQSYMGISWILGCFGFGFIVFNNSVECRISRQNLCQASLLLISLSILSLTIIRGYNAYVIFVWIYGIFLGGFNYSIKMYIYEKVRARNFARAWGFVQLSMGVPNLIGVPIIGYLNVFTQGKEKSFSGYYLSGASVMAGSLLLILVDFHKSRLRRKRAKESALSGNIAGGPKSQATRTSSVHVVPVELAVQKLEHEGSPNENFIDDGSFAEGIANDEEDDEEDGDEDLEDDEGIQLKSGCHYFDDDDDIIHDDLLLYDLGDRNLDEDEEDDFLEENITSCNKVENIVILSELEHNMIIKNLQERDKELLSSKDIHGLPVTLRQKKQYPCLHMLSKRSSDPLDECKKHDVINSVIEEESSI